MQDTTTTRDGHAVPRAGGAPGDHPPGEPPRLEFVRLTKRFSGFTAVDHVSFAVRPGEVHVLFGENGAGKSTMISMISGALVPDEGEILFDGEPVREHTVHAARDRGISAVFQEFSLVPQLSVEENLFLGNEPRVGPVLDRRALRRKAREILDELGFALDPTRPVAELTRAEQQMVEIAKAFRGDLTVLILDEPTASLTDREADHLFDLVEKVKASGTAVIYITHRMAEIRRIGDRISVLRDGKYVGTVDAATTDEDTLVQMMTGRVIDQIFPDIARNAGETRLAIAGLSTRSRSVRGASLSVAAGEVVGLAGLVGSGKSEVMRACFGLEQVTEGRVTLNGEDVTGLSPGEMIRRGFYYNPPDRREEGLMMLAPAYENVMLPALDRPDMTRAGLLDRAKERRTAKDLAARLNLQPPNVDRLAGFFSGGNQQKVLLAKCLTREVTVYVFDEPTIGVDVGTRAQIYRFIEELCEAGAAIVLVSSDLPEVIHLSHRVYTFYRGEITSEMEGEAITEENLLPHFFEREGDEAGAA